MHRTGKGGQVWDHAGCWWWPGVGTESGRTKGQGWRLEVKGINRGAVHVADTLLSIRKNNFSWSFANSDQFRASGPEFLRSPGKCFTFTGSKLIQIKKQLDK